MKATPRTLLPALALAASGAAAQAGPDWKTVTTGAPLKPGISGRISVRPPAAPPPVIYARPVRASGEIGVPRMAPIYLYVPPGQVRKWKNHCAKWKACDRPVLFVRVDDSPSQWGQWKHRREQVATLLDDE